MALNDKPSTGLRCLAKTRQGGLCQTFAVAGRKRCRMHGGTNPGAPKGNKNALKHGARAESASVHLRRAYHQIIASGIPGGEIPSELLAAKSMVVKAKTIIKEKTRS